MSVILKKESKIENWRIAAVYDGKTEDSYDVVGPELLYLRR